MSDIHQKALALDKAYREGDLGEVRRLLGDPRGFPNCEQPFELGCGGTPLEYAFCWSPQRLILDLLRLGADVNHTEDDGFPPLFNLLSSIGRRGSTKAIHPLKMPRHWDLTWPSPS